MSAADEVKVVDLTTTTHVAQVETVTTAEEILDFQKLVRMVPIGESAGALCGRPGSRHAPQQRIRARLRQEIRQLRRQRARRAVPGPGGQSTRVVPTSRYHVAYEDITALATPVLRHRILLNFHAESDRIDSDEILRRLLEHMPPPSGGLMLQRFLDPRVLAGISGLDLVAKTVVDGFVAGLHRSPDFGFSQEFAEYRAYSPGDDLRHVDWNVFARTERAYLKRYRGETNSMLTVLLDASNSMNFTSHGVNKMDYARFTAASLFYLAIKISAMPRG